MTIFWTSLSFERSRTKVKVTMALFRKKNIVIALVPLFIVQFQYNFIGYDYTSNKFAFQLDRVKVKVAVTLFRKT